jgi:hypothetical protein
MLEKIPETSAVAQKLKITTAATVDAQAGLPVPDARMLSETEVQIESFWKGQFDILNADYSKKHHGIIQDMSETIGAANRILNSELSEIENNLNAVVTENTRRQAELTKELSDNQREYDDFRKYHDLIRTHKPINQFFVYLTVAIFMFEAIINAVIYMPTMPGGGIAGGAVSVTIALINVGYSYLSGKYFLTQWLLPKAVNKLIAIILALLWGGIILSVNILAGLLRQISEEIAQNYTKIDMVFMNVTVDKMAVVFKPEEWPDLAFNSVLLIALGIFFALIALIDGWFCRDAYPGYARVGTKLDKTRHDKKMETELAVDNLRDTFDQGMAQIESFEEEIAQISNDIDNSINELGSSWTGKDDMIKLILDRAKSNILLYRNTNTQQRSSSSPEYFNSEAVSIETLNYITTEKEDRKSDILPGGNSVNNLTDFKVKFSADANNLTSKMKESLISVFDKNNKLIQL